MIRLALAGVGASVVHLVDRAMAEMAAVVRAA